MKPIKPTPERLEAMAEFISSTMATKALREKSDAQLADLVDEHLMARIPMIGAEYALLEEVVRRLRKEEP